MRDLTVTVAFVFMVGCSSQPAKAPGDGGPNGTDVAEDRPADLASVIDGNEEDRPADVSTVTDGNDVALDGPCTGSIEQVQTSGFRGGGPACAATYGAALQGPPSCGPPTRLVTYKPCGGFLVLSANCGTHGRYCVYDAVSLALVGSAVFDDIPSFCQQRSFCIQGGTLPAELQCSARGNLLNTCVRETDGGTIDATDASDGPTDSD